jgi:lipopolysaccharide export system protein LptC
MRSAAARTGRPRAAVRHSRVVDLLRVLLPATALALFGLVIAWPYMGDGAGGLIGPVLGEVEIDADRMLMHHPRYVGRTEKSEPFEVTALTAHLDPKNPNRVHLAHIAADLDKAGSRDLRLVATSGVFDRARDKLDLAGGVELITSDGYRFESDSARINLNDNRVVGKEPISGTGPRGTLEADRFVIREGGDVMQFVGRVKVTLPGAAE